MKEPYIEGSATHDDPESCAATRKRGGEALTGARTGAVLSREIRHSGAPTPLCEAEGHMGQRRQREPLPSPARSETRRTDGSFLRENRESPASPVADGAAGRAGKAQRRTPAMNEVGQSDRLVVPAKPTTKPAPRRRSWCPYDRPLTIRVVCVRIGRRAALIAAASRSMPRRNVSGGVEANPSSRPFLVRRPR